MELRVCVIEERLETNSVFVYYIDCLVAQNTIELVGAKSAKGILKATSWIGPDAFK